MNLRKPLGLFLLLLLMTSFVFVVPKVSLAETPCDNKSDSDKARCLTDLMAEYENKIKQLQGEQKTLAATISYLNNKIRLTEAQIWQTEYEIKMLEGEITKLSLKINELDVSLSDVSQLLANRIETTYKRNRLKPIFLLFSSSNFADFFSKIKYLKAAQMHDRELMMGMEESRANFDAQKKLKEEKQKELETLQKRLGNQKIILVQQETSKQELLKITKNDEQNFQNLLAQIRNEYQSILAILAGKGEETKTGDIKEGERIAYVIQGSSCNSSGTHLHFTVADDDGNPSNPFSYLKGVDYENCSGGGNCNPADQFNPSGSWNWPLNPKITLNQGYGKTWAIENTWVGQIYSFHNGIDIVGSSNEVKAVRDGTLYRGSYTGYNGCKLPYMRIDNKEGDLNTYYLHVI